MRPQFLVSLTPLTPSLRGPPCTSVQHGPFPEAVISCPRRWPRWDWRINDLETAGLPVPAATRAFSNWLFSHSDVTPQCLTSAVVPDGMRAARLVGQMTGRHRDAPHSRATWPLLPQRQDATPSSYLRFLRIFLFSIHLFSLWPSWAQSGEEGWHAPLVHPVLRTRILLHLYFFVDSRCLEYVCSNIDLHCLTNLASSLGGKTVFEKYAIKI